MGMRLVVLDYDGTLVDSMTHAVDAMRSIFGCFGIPPHPEAIYRKEVTNHFMDFYHAYGIPRSATAEDLQRLWQRFFEERAICPDLRQGVRDLLKHCEQEQYLMGIVSASPIGIVMRGLHGHGIDTHFAFVCANMLQKDAILTKIRESLGLASGEICYVGDTAEDVVAARRAGCIAIGICGGFRERHILAASAPDHLIDELGELPAILRNHHS